MACLLARWLADGGATRRWLPRQQWHGAALCSHVLGRSEWARAKAADEAVSAWRRRVRDGLTSGGSAGVRPPLGVFGLTPVGHVGLNPKPSEPASSDCQRVFITSKLQIGGELAKHP